MRGGVVHLPTQCVPATHEQALGPPIQRVSTVVFLETGRFSFLPVAAFHFFSVTGGPRGALFL
jgi:hypothetical protein